MTRQRGLASALLRRGWRTRSTTGRGGDRAVDALESTWEVLLSALGRLAEGSISLTGSSLPTLARDQPPPISTVPQPTRIEDAVSTWLARHDIEKDWLIAAPLARAGVDVAWCERAAAVLDGAALEPGLEWVASTVSAQTLLAEVKESTRRISELVGAVKSYSQLDRASMQETDVAEGLESTLVMLAHRIPEESRRTRLCHRRPRMAPPPASSTRCDEPHRQRRRRDGRCRHLRVSTRADDDAVIVEIEDTAPA
jgi:hypothetical protein